MWGVSSTVRRSSRHAQDTWVKAHDSAIETYGEGERAHRTAFAALKHSYEKGRRPTTGRPLRRALESLTRGDEVLDEALIDLVPVLRAEHR